MGTLDRNLAVKVAEKKDAILLQDKVEMLAQPSTNDESNGENEGRSGWREGRVFRVYAVFGPSIVDIHKLQEVPKMTIDWFARWGAERRLAWGRWKMVCCGWWVDWAQWEKPARAKQAPAAVRNSQIRHKRERLRRSCSLVELPKRWTGRPEPRGSRCFPIRRQQSMVPSWTSVSVGVGRRVEAWGIEGSGSPTWLWENRVVVFRRRPIARPKSPSFTLPLVSEKGSKARGKRV